MKTKTLTERTKGIWEVNYQDFGEFIIRNEKWDIAKVMGYDMPEDEAEANAAFICKAANSHESLLNALKEALQIIERMSEEYSEVAKKHASFTNGEYKRIDQAIKNAE